MKKLVLTGIFLLPFLTGCAFLDFFRKDDNFPITDKVVAIDPKLLEECKRLDKIVQGQKEVEFEDIGEKYITLIGDYGVCANRQLKSIEAIKKLSNIPEGTK